jgi:alanine dehydrogenase
VKIGLIRERKNPPDKRVAFLPEQCKLIEEKYPEIHFQIEPSNIRCVPDEMYAGTGLEMGSNPKNCEILFGIKEVPPVDLISGKTYFFFSHTIKKQAHNKKLLQTAIEKEITLVDYECLLDKNGVRTVAFGRFAGIVGAYNALRMWMFRFHQIRLKPAFECGDMEEMLDYANHHTAVLSPIKIAITGRGRVGQGAIEVFQSLGIKEVSPFDYCNQNYSVPVFTVLSSKHYYENLSHKNWDENHFRKNPKEYRSHFMDFARCTDVLIPCHYWDPNAPVLFTKDDVKKPDFKIKVISDVTCDLNGSIPTTIRTSTIADPFFDIDAQSFEEKIAFSSEKNITICAVDNLPCELPYDASKAFGEMLIESVIPELVTKNYQSIEKAIICRKGELMPNFKYLQDYVGSEVKV